MYRDEELRKLPTGYLYGISEILEINEDWKKVMSLIPKDLTVEKFEPKYNMEHIRAVAEHAKAMKKNCAEVLFDEWGTTGRKRPTLAHLQNIIIQAGVYRAADEIALMLGEPSPTRPDMGPAARIDTSHLTDLITTNGRGRATDSTARMRSSRFPSLSDLPQKIISLASRVTAPKETRTEPIDTEYSAETSGANIPNFNAIFNKDMELKKMYPTVQYPAPPFRIDTVILENKELVKFDYEELKEITCKFSDAFIRGPLGPTGKIGSGGFGDVYAGIHPKHGSLAVKKFRDLSFINPKPDLVSQTFNAEIKCLAQLRHENIVPILGYSIQEQNGSFPSLCIVCQYIEGGSLEFNLSHKTGNRLTEKQRINIMVGTAKGLRYIHNRDSAELPDTEHSYMHYIHGDVKSANILLTREYQPKLCDFGLAKQFNTTIVTPCVMGTTPYMSPERLQGTNTQKADIYSFGIVLLELLTGQQSLVKKDKGIVNLQDHITEVIKSGKLSDAYDPSVESWTKAEEIYALAKKCLVYDYGNRPNIDELCEELAKLSSEGLETITEAAESLEKVDEAVETVTEVPKTVEKVADTVEKAEETGGEYS